MNTSSYHRKIDKPWALQWISPRALATIGANPVRLQFLVALAAKRERTAK